MKQFALLLLACGVAAGCGTGGLATGPAPAAVAAPAARQTSAVAFTFTPAARDALQADARFDVQALREAILKELGARGLLAADAGVAEVLIDAYSVEAKGNTVLFGRLPSTGRLAGTLQGRDQVVAEVTLNLAQDGRDAKPLEKLYKRFADAVADALAGVPRKPVIRD